MSWRGHDRRRRTKQECTATSDNVSSGLANRYSSRYRILTPSRYKYRYFFYCIQPTTVRLASHSLNAQDNVMATRRSAGDPSESTGGCLLRRIPGTAHPPSAVYPSTCPVARSTAVPVARSISIPVSSGSFKSMAGASMPNSRLPTMASLPCPPHDPATFEPAAQGEKASPHLCENIRSPALEVTLILEVDLNADPGMPGVTNRGLTGVAVTGS